MNGALVTPLFLFCEYPSLWSQVPPRGRGTPVSGPRYLLGGGGRGTPVRTNAPSLPNLDRTRTGGSPLLSPSPSPTPTPLPLPVMLRTVTERSCSYHFFWANQWMADIKIFSCTQYEISKDRCDWHILARNGQRIVSQNLNRNGRYSMSTRSSLVLFDRQNTKSWVDKVKSIINEMCATADDNNLLKLHDHTFSTKAQGIHPISSSFKRATSLSQGLHFAQSFLGK